MTQFITFDDIKAAAETNTELPSFPGRLVRLRALDPIEVMDYIENAKRVDEQDPNAAREFIGMVRTVVVKGMVTPSLTDTSVREIPGKVLMEMFNAVVEHSGAGGAAEEEAETFRPEPTGPDGGAADE